MQQKVLFRDSAEVQSLSTLENYAQRSSLRQAQTDTTICHGELVEPFADYTQSAGNFFN